MRHSFGKIFFNRDKKVVGSIWVNCFFIICIVAAAPLASIQTVEEKRQLASSVGTGHQEGDALKKVNQELARERRQLETLGAEIALIYARNADEKEYKHLLEEVNTTRNRMLELENAWRESIVTEAKRDEEGYALWDQEETTLSSLVMEYGASDYLYIVPPELAGIKINMHSGIPIPRESWGEALEIILNHNGIGIKKLNAYARHLYVFKQDLSCVQAIVCSESQLQWIPPHARIFYVFSPPVEQVRSAMQFFERFADARQTFVHQMGGKVVIVASRDDVSRLLQLHRTVWQNAHGKVTKVVTVSKIAVKEMEKILQVFFGDMSDRSGPSIPGRPPFAKPEQEGLGVYPLSTGNTLVLIGTQEVVDRAEKIVRTTEEQMCDPSEITVFLYNCRHSDPVDLSKVLEKVYNSLLVLSPEANKEAEANFQAKVIGPNPGPPADGFATTPPLMIGPRPINSGTHAHLDLEEGSERFIPDPKTGTILMVVRRDALTKIKDLLRQIDIPKKMVQIEVLLFEKRHNTQNNFGLNLLRIGPQRNHVDYTGLFAPQGKGILEFVLGKNHGKGFPSFDLTYSFLMAQEDVQLHAAPSVMTINQTPATISIQEEISINNGAAPIDTNKGIAFEKSFSRAQYGITIMLTPIIHSPSSGEEKVDDGSNFITLQTNITFDTTKPHTAHDDRPSVERRHIENEVRVPDGETIIIGGLRRSTMRDEQDKVPFFGELPIIGRLFGSTRLIDHNTEMFFFITPKIVLGQREKLEEIRMEELQKRPGDIPEFLQRVMEARQREQRGFFEHSLKVFFRETRP